MVCFVRWSVSVFDYFAVSGVVVWLRQEGFEVTLVGDLLFRIELVIEFVEVLVLPQIGDAARVDIPKFL